MSTSLDSLKEGIALEGLEPQPSPLTPSAASVKASLATPKLATARDLHDWIAADTSLPQQKRRNEMSAIKALGKATNQPLAVIPLDPAYLNEKVFALTPAQAGFGTDRWKHIRTYCGQALKRGGVLVVAVRRRNTLSLKWQTVLERLPEKPLMYRLSALARFCSANGCEPDAVSQAVFDLFYHEETTHTVKGPKAYGSYRTASRTWNDAVGRFSWWPQVTIKVPDYSNRLSIAKKRFPDSFWHDFDDYEAASSTPKGKGRPFSLQKTKQPRQLRRATIEHRCDLCWEMASAQVHMDRNIEEIVSLRALVEPKWVAEGLNFLLKRYNGKRTKRLHEFVSTMKSIAGNWVHPEQDALDALSGLCKDAEPDEVAGFSEKNKTALMQFDSPEKVQTLQRLPYVIAVAIRAKKKITVEDARLMLGAMAIEVLLTTMVRLENLANIDIHKNLRTVGTAENLTRLLIFESQNVKNDKALSLKLLPRTWRLWCFFVEKCRPLLLTEATTLLFPLAETSKKRKSRLRHLVVKLIKDRTGLRLGVHQFRHFGVMRYRQNFPDDLETPRIALGHKDQRTLRKYYAWLDETEAWKNFTKVVLGDCDKWIAELGF